MSLNQKSKQNLLDSAKLHVQKIRNKIDDYIEVSKNLSKEFSTKKSTSDAIGDALMLDKMYKMRVLSHQEKVEEYNFLKDEPYFSRCDVKMADGKMQTFYFSKFSIIEDDIYSWVSPASRLRFETMGKFSIPTPNGNVLQGELLRKDQFMIVNGEIIFMASEASEYDRTLIHQEYLSNRKTAGFAMQDIVAMMEKAQDHVIRADHKGSFLISGPAGSGKTTLALHRVAYLVQSPETSPLYPSNKIVVFVQDSSTKDYFSALLPKLGINDVKITTFFEWAAMLLGIKIEQIQSRIGNSENERDVYEFEKRNALKNLDETIRFNKNHFAVLEKVYKEYFSKQSKTIWSNQKDKKIYDRFDLTILLQIYKNTKGILEEEYIDYVKVKGRSKLNQKIAYDPIEYSLIIVDETQNYLPEQIDLIKSVVDKKTNSILYVGDLVQQTHLGTLRNWDEVGEDFTSSRQAKLEKVYRNTKQILEYIQSVGFKVSIDTNLRDGIDVKEALISDQQDEIQYLNNLIQEKDEEILGILTKTKEHSEYLKQILESKPNVKIMTINEAQGVEFDVVCLTEIDQETFIPQIDDAQLLQEKRRVNKDLLYVALTRAMNELHIVGKENLKEIVFKLQNDKD